MEGEDRGAGAAAAAVVETESAAAAIAGLSAALRSMMGAEILWPPTPAPRRSAAGSLGNSLVVRGTDTTERDAGTEGDAAVEAPGEASLCCCCFVFRACRCSFRITLACLCACCSRCAIHARLSSESK